MSVRIGAHPRRRSRAWQAAGFLLLCLAGPVAQAAQAPEHKVKAAFIYNFIRFVEWPEGSGDKPIRVGIAGSDAVVATVRDALNDRTVGARAIVVERLTTADAVPRFDAIYVAGNDSERARAFVAAAQGRPILTITESDRFLTVGSLVNFYLAEESVRFAVNATLLDRSQLKMSSQMLQFAAIVRTGR